MRIVEEGRRGAKANWLTRLRLRDGRETFHTGRSIAAYRDADHLRQQGWWCVHRRQLEQIAAIEHGPNVVFEAAMRPEGGKLVDSDDGCAYYANDGVVFRLLEAVASGRIRIEDGRLLGRWTFKRQSGVVTVDMAEDGTGQEAPAGVEDLSEFIKQMPVG